ncbi:acyl-CoA dehydrogenase family protein [Pseudomonas sp. PDM09]|uniref:acyl-CoA dehydrogenase family protein n=1 Tax=Pseudomonas sp. PDM09 TaxID=2769270 RepID=UPI00177A80B2|nr:acyl-CoA dehydrogenase family protein [Pseudomonas sp. PDM09]MBD9562272.1 acyl-CoA dehydrogenase family protein [Pseudomonas sp. PDM09]
MHSNHEEREELRLALRSILKRIWPAEEAVTRSTSPAALETLWRALCANDVVLMRSAQDLAMVMNECGRVAAAIPLIGAAIALPLLDVAQANALTRGDLRIAVALGRFDGDRLAGSLQLEGDRANGQMAAIEDWSLATHLLAIADDGQSAALIETTASGLVAEPTPGFATPALVQLRMENVACKVIALVPRFAEHSARLARLLLCARASGAGRRGLELAVSYVRLREQFDQPIGRFQAVQHKLADCMVNLDICELMIDNCADAIEAGEGAFESAALLAVASPGLRKVALELHHAFGAIGYAEEHELPRHFRRIHADMLRLGSAPEARLHLGKHLLQNGTPFPPFRNDPDAERLRQQVRTWLGQHWDADARAASCQRPFAERDSDLNFIGELGKQGWLSINWPESHGGLGLSPLEQLAFVEEIHGCGAPIALSQAGSWLIAPALIKFGSQQLQDQFLPLIASGAARFCLGYSEPEAGSDLASLRTRATRDGDEFVINGQKLWTTLAETATHVFLAARTDPDAKPKHAGISLFIVPTDAPGVDIHPGMALYGRTFSTVFYDDVRIPASNLVGELNGGWGVLTSALASERVLMGGSVARLKALLENIAGALHERRNDAVVLDRIGGLAAELHAARLLAMRSVQLLQKGAPALLEGAVSKLFTGEFAERLGETALELFGIGATLSEESDLAPIAGSIEQHVRASIMAVIGGGTAEIQRTLIAQRGLGLPR